MSGTIFSEYYTYQQFSDRYISDPTDNPITIIIPCAHVNEIFENNLKSIYREVPVCELLLGDAGLSSELLDLARLFPRVRILDHRGFTLGYSLKGLIERVRTSHFAYLHSDVYLPPGWFDSMIEFIDDYDWYGCRMLQTSMIVHDQPYGERPYAGAQIGRKTYFEKGISRIDDDYMWRQEDFILQQIVEDAGGRVGAIDNVFHYHQLMPKPSTIWQTNIKNVSFQVDSSREQQDRVMKTQLYGIIKYTQPRSRWLLEEVNVCLRYMLDNELITGSEFFQWVSQVNASWTNIVRELLRIYYRSLASYSP